MACSEAVARELRGLGVGLPAGSVAIPNGLNVADFEARRAATRGQRVGGPVIGMVARLDGIIKDQLTLLRAFATVRASLPDAILWIVGDGVERPLLEAEAERLKVGACVRFFGTRTDIPELLGRMHLYAFATTRAEGFRHSFDRSDVRGRADCCERRAGLPRGVGGRDAGVLVPPGDPAAWQRR